ncbi:hypothetical protein SAMN05421642_116126, partial [Rhodococcoides kyotonense]
KTLGWKTPLQIFTDIVEEYNESLVATTD